MEIFSHIQKMEWVLLCKKKENVLIQWTFHKINGENSVIPHTWSLYHHGHWVMILGWLWWPDMIHIMCALCDKQTRTLLVWQAFEKMKQADQFDMWCRQTSDHGRSPLFNVRMPYLCLHTSLLSRSFCLGSFPHVGFHIYMISLVISMLKLLAIGFKRLNSVT